MAALGCTGVFAGAGAFVGAGTDPPRAAAAAAQPPKAAAGFERNDGQLPASVEFAMRGGGGVFVTRDGARVRGMRMQWAGARAAGARGRGRLPGVVNSYVGEPERWRSGVPTFRRVEQARVWPGIDVVWLARGERVEYDFEVAPGADPRAIGFRVPGARRIAVRAGDLAIRMRGGRIVRQRKPVAWQVRAGNRRPVRSAFAVRPDGTVGFTVGDYDRSLPLVIDPVVTYASYLGGAGAESVDGFVRAGDGSLLLSGGTTSSDLGLGPGDTGSADDAFVVKLNAARDTLLYTTFFGGANQDVAQALAVAADGRALVGGFTFSEDFPVTVGAYDNSKSTNTDPEAWVARLAPSTGAIEWATYLGAGEYGEEVNDIAVAADGSAWAVGSTSNSTFPATAGAYDPTHTGDGDSDGFVMQLSADGSAITRSTFIGASGGDEVEAVAVASDGGVVIGGFTEAAAFPTVGAFDATRGGTADAWVAKLDSTAATLVHSTYLGGSGGGVDERVRDLELDAAGRIVLTGTTTSNDFPTQGPVQATFGGGTTDGFVARMPAVGGSLDWSTYTGGASNDTPAALALDADGAPTVAGSTASADYPLASPNQTSNAGANDGFITRFDAGGTARTYSTYLGTPANDFIGNVVLDGTNAIVAGWTDSPLNVSTSGAHQPANAGAEDLFVVEYAPASSGWRQPLTAGGFGVAGMSGPYIATNAAGNAYAVWCDNASGDIQGAYWDAGAWGTVETVGTSGGCDRQQAAFDPVTGEIAIVWSGGGNVQGRWRGATAAGAFSATTHPLSTGTNNIQSDIDIDGTGDVTAVWIGDAPIEIRARRLLASDTLGTQFILSGPAASSPQVAVGGLGDATAVWEEGGNIRSNTFFELPSEQWLGAQPVGAGDAPYVAVDGQDNAIAAWRVPGAGEVRSARRNNGLGQPWGGVTTQSAVGETVINGSMRLSLRAGGPAAIIWTGAPNGVDYFPRVVLDLDGDDTWSAAQSLDTSTSGGMDSFRPVDLKRDGNDNLLATWTSLGAPGARVIQAARMTPAGTWTPTMTLTPFGGSASTSQLALTSGGNAMLMYTDTTGGNPIARSVEFVAPAGPQASTAPPGATTAATAIARGVVNPENEPVSYEFQYGLTPGYGQVSATGTVPAGVRDVTVSQTLTGLAPNTTYNYRLRATTPSGTTTGPNRTVVTSPASPPPPGDGDPPATGAQDQPPAGPGGGPGGGAATPPLPEPVLAKTVNIAPVSGTVLVKLPRTTRFILLSQAAQVPVGSLIDTRKGRVRLFAADGRGKVQTADFYQGLFKLTQPAKLRGMVELLLSGGRFAGCGKALKPATAAAKRKTRSIRRLWGDGKGKFRTVGRYSSATLRGTTWLTDDRCDATLTRVTRGSVNVRDFARRKTVVVRAPKQYLAKRG